MKVRAMPLARHGRDRTAGRRADHRQHRPELRRPDADVIREQGEDANEREQRAGKSPQ